MIISFSFSSAPTQTHSRYYMNIINTNITTAALLLIPTLILQLLPIYFPTLPSLQNILKCEGERKYKPKIRQTNLCTMISVPKHTCGRKRNHFNKTWRYIFSVQHKITYLKVLFGEKIRKIRRERWMDRYF